MNPLLDSKPPGSMDFVIHSIGSVLGLQVGPCLQQVFRKSVCGVTGTGTSLPPLLRPQEQCVASLIPGNCYSFPSYPELPKIWVDTLKFHWNKFLNPKDKIPNSRLDRLGYIYLLTHISERGNNVQNTKASLKDLIQSKAQPVTISKGHGILSCFK